MRCGAAFVLAIVLAVLAVGPIGCYVGGGGELPLPGDGGSDGPADAAADQYGG